MNYAVFTLFKTLNSIDIDISLCLAKEVNKYNSLNTDKEACVNAINKLHGTRNDKINLERAIDLLNAELQIQERRKEEEKAQSIRNAIIQLYS